VKGIRKVKRDEKLVGRKRREAEEGHISVGSKGGVRKEGKGHREGQRVWKNRGSEELVSSS
jgi:hypothetical protein